MLGRTSNYFKYRIYNELLLPIQGVFNRYIKGSNIQAALGAQALYDFYASEAATKARKDRSTLKRHLKGGVLITRDARRIIKEKEEVRIYKNNKKKTNTTTKPPPNNNTSTQTPPVPNTATTTPCVIDPQLLEVSQYAIDSQQVQ